MTIGPHGEKRPGNVIANAVHVAKLATGEAEEEYVDESKRAGGRARAEALTAEERQAIGRKGAAVAAARKARQ